jgi:DNA-binding transcriptional ArsR family regulator
MTAANGFQLQAKLFRALAHPVRLQILNVLAKREACVCHLEALLGRPQPYVSQQLATLREAGLVKDRREGTLIYYSAADDRLAAWLRLGQELMRDSEGRPVVFPVIPEGALEGCPCPRCQE